MAKYTFKQSYPTFWVVLFLLILFLGVAVVFILISMLKFDSKIIFIIGVISFFIAALILPRRLASCLIEISMNEKEIKKRFIQKCFFEKKGVQNKIFWEDIQDFGFKPSRQFDKFKILLKNGGRFKFYHNNDDDNKDDFLRFVKDFKLLMKERKK